MWCSIDLHAPHTHIYIDCWLVNLFAWIGQCPCSALTPNSFCLFAAFAIMLQADMCLPDVFEVVTYSVWHIATCIAGNLTYRTSCYMYRLVSYAAYALSRLSDSLLSWMYTVGVDTFNGRQNISPSSNCCLWWYYVAQQITHLWVVSFIHMPHTECAVYTMYTLLRCFRRYICAIAWYHE